MEASSSTAFAADFEYFSTEKATKIKYKQLGNTKVVFMLLHP